MTGVRDAQAPAPAVPSPRPTRTVARNKTTRRAKRSRATSWRAERTRPCVRADHSPQVVVAPLWAQAESVRQGSTGFAIGARNPAQALLPAPAQPCANVPSLRMYRGDWSNIPIPPAFMRSWGELVRESLDRSDLNLVGALLRVASWRPFADEPVLNLDRSPPSPDRVRVIGARSGARSIRVLLVAVRVQRGCIDRAREPPHPRRSRRPRRLLQSPLMTAQAPIGRHGRQRSRRRSSLGSAPESHPEGRSLQNASDPRNRHLLPILLKWGSSARRRAS